MAQLVDFNQFLIAAFTSGGTQEYKMTESIARHRMLQSIVFHNKKFRDKYGKMVFCADDPRGSWRKHYFPYYKANRDKAKRDSGVDWELIKHCLNLFYDELDTYFPYPCVRVEGAEGDDVIAALVRYYQKNELEGGLWPQPQNTIILSSDKDFKQLQRYKNVDQWSPRQKKFMREKRPDLYLREHIMRGDSSDGIPNFLSDDDAILSPDKRQKPLKTTKVEQWIEMSPEEITEGNEELERNYDRNRRLVDLVNCVPEELERDIVERYNIAPVASRDKLLTYFSKFRLKNLMSNIQYV